MCYFFRSSPRKPLQLGSRNSDQSQLGGRRSEQLQLGSRNSDNGYSSGADGCENCSMPSSNDGSDIVCSDGVCNGHCGK